MNEAIRDVRVTGYDELIPSLQLPDPDDRHVLAAAIRCSAQTIVTQNVRDFPKETLAKYGIEAQHPDELIEHLIDLDGETLGELVVATAADKRRPPMTPQEIVASLRAAGLARSADLLLEIITPSSGAS